VTKLKGGKGDKTTKFTCSHCNTTYTGPYTHVRKHLYGMTQYEEKKSIGIKACDKVTAKEIDTGGKWRNHKTNPKNQGLNLRPQTHIKCLIVDPHPPMLSVSCPSIQVIEKNYISLNKVVGMTWLQKCSDFSMYVSFNVICSPNWQEMVQAINSAPKGYRRSGYGKAIML
jgi:hypothetical protein